jgi:hypothetical protein
MLGHSAKDRITGLAGVITAKAEFQFAPRRWELTPDKLNKDGNLCKQVWLDEPRLELTSKKATIGVNLVEPTIQLGDLVQDSITGKKGVVTGRYTFNNGCIRIEVTPKDIKPDAEQDSLVFDEQRLLVLEGGKKKVVEQVASKPGGPRPGPTAYSRP